MISEMLGVSLNDLFFFCFIVSLIVYMVLMFKISRSPKVQSLESQICAPVYVMIGEPQGKGREKKIEIKSLTDPFGMVNKGWKLVSANPKDEEKERS